MDEICALCEGRGMRIVERADGSRAARECDCRLERRRLRTLKQAAIPRLYGNSTLESFVVDPNSDEPSLGKARYTARRFVSAYPLETRGKGLLITGSVGTGKTHLAVGILRGLIETRGANGLFCHYHELIKQVQNSFNPEVKATEMQVLEPILNAEVLVLDELGATKPSDWVFDTIAHILNTRYNENRTTIITTNYRNEQGVLRPMAVLSAMEQSREAMRRETLGDRIGERMLSRLQEMCVVLEMVGPDYRTTQKAARFG